MTSNEWVDYVIKIVPAVAAIGAGLFAFLRWLDVRRREIADSEFQQVSRLIMIVTGQYPDGRGARIVDQIFAVWLLKEFPKYHDAIRNALDRQWDPSFTSDLFVQQVVPEIEKMLQQLPARTK